MAPIDKDYSSIVEEDLDEFVASFLGKEEAEGMQNHVYNSRSKPIRDHDLFTTDESDAETDDVVLDADDSESEPLQRRNLKKRKRAFKVKFQFGKSANQAKRAKTTKSGQVLVYRIVDNKVEFLHCKRKGKWYHGKSPSPLEEEDLKELAVKNIQAVTGLDEEELSVVHDFEASSTYTFAKANSINVSYWLAEAKVTNEVYIKTRNRRLAWRNEEESCQAVDDDKMASIFKQCARYIQENLPPGASEAKDTTPEADEGADSGWYYIVKTCNRTFYICALCLKVTKTRFNIFDHCRRLHPSVDRSASGVRERIKGVMVSTLYNDIPFVSVRDEIAKAKQRIIEGGIHESEKRDLLEKLCILDQKRLVELKKQSTAFKKGSKKITCEECGHVDNVLDDHRKHMKIHQELKYECPLCNIRDTREHRMTKHIRVTHNRDLAPKKVFIENRPKSGKKPSEFMTKASQEPKSRKKPSNKQKTTSAKPLHPSINKATTDGCLPPDMLPILRLKRIKLPAENRTTATAVPAAASNCQDFEVTNGEPAGDPPIESTADKFPKSFTCPICGYVAANKKDFIVNSHRESDDE